VTEFWAGLIVLAQYGLAAVVCAAAGIIVWHTRIAPAWKQAELSDRYRDGWMVGKGVGREEALREITAKRSEAGRKAAATRRGVA